MYNQPNTLIVHTATGMHAFILLMSTVKVLIISPWIAVLTNFVGFHVTHHMAGSTGTRQVKLLAEENQQWALNLKPFDYQFNAPTTELLLPLP